MTLSATSDSHKTRVVSLNIGRNSGGWVQTPVRCPGTSQGPVDTPEADA